MAGKIGRVVVTGIAVTAVAGTETLAQIVAAANHPVDILEVHVSFRDTDATHPPELLEILRQTDAGTSVAATPVDNNNSDGDTFDTTARKTVTAEPTASDILHAQAAHPQTYWSYIPLKPIHVGAADRVGVRINTPANNQTMDITIVFEE